MNVALSAAAIQKLKNLSLHFDVTFIAAFVV